MKKFSGLILVLTVLMACNQDPKTSSSTTTTDNLISTEKPTQIADVPWSVVTDSTSQKMKLVQNEEVTTQELDSSNVTEALVRKYPEIKIVWIKQQNDTAFVKILDAEFLTQSSGSMGGQIFMAEVTYSYTQIPGINFVNFSFKEGDHASPGTYDRSNFSFSK
ncbi:hypothetical protein FA046_12130 [Pedobacter cryophilus]|uniref:Uncharacterized protein n=2 Tax=Pedobacter cryophilus TaxID=2571271 RepID=A0A4U1BVK3_9SPHI|nr:hypothetical protein FA046_12130 [Pedobacter cryophilus]